MHFLEALFKSDLAKCRHILLPYTTIIITRFGDIKKKILSLIFRHRQEASSFPNTRDGLRPYLVEYESIRGHSR